PKDALESLQQNFEVANDGTQTLTPEQMSATLQDFESDSNIKELAEPEVTTTVGRQTEMRATEIQTIITKFIFQETSTNSEIAPRTEKVEFGPVLDVIPNVSSDGQKIKLTTIASDTKFFGYADPKNSPESFATNSAGEKVNLPAVLPVVQMNRASVQAVVSDGETLVLFPKAEVQQDQRLAQHIAQTEKKNGKKYLVAFITPTIVDASGNRIHSEK
ncbi:MAG: hypothetical protein ACREDS_16015, partial [Limisphaerales bacterium]